VLTSLLLATTLAAPPTASLEVTETLTSEGEAWTLTVRVHDLRSDDGKVLAQLFDSEKGFPGKNEHAIDQGRSKITNGSARLVWEGLPRGTYAVAIIHDENGNGKLDTNLIGMPKEGVAASRNARARFGPFKWKDAKFEHAGATKMSVKMRYL
jgi:uncharacterized protein (DUF2141 family)